MIKTYLTVIAVLFFSLPMLAQQPAKTLFNNIPDRLCPTLTKVNRADFIDFMESNMRAVVTDRFNTSCEMTNLTSDYLKIQLTEKSSWEMKVLPVNDSTQVVCTINTYAAPVADSKVSFYDTDWNELETSAFLTLPESADAFVCTEKIEQKEQFERLYKHIDMLLMQAQLNEADTSLKLTLTTPDYIEKETAEKLEPFLRRNITFVWNEGRFMPSIEQ